MSIIINKEDVIKLKKLKLKYGFNSNILKYFIPINYSQPFVSDKKINIIAEVMTDGRGDFAWVKTLIEIILNCGIKHENISVYLMCQFCSLIDSTIAEKMYDIGNSFKECINDEDKDNFNNLLTDVDNIKLFIKKRPNIQIKNIEKLDELISMINENQTDKLNRIKDHKKEKCILDDSEKLMYDKTSVDTYYKNDDYKIGKYMNDAYNLTNNNINFYLIDSVDFLIEDTKFFNSLLKKINSNLNILFLTGEYLDNYDNFFKNKPKVIIREGGHTDNNAINAGYGTNSHGLLNANINININELNTFLKQYELSIKNPYHVIYMSGSDETHGYKLSLFLMLLEKKYPSYNQNISINVFINEFAYNNIINNQKDQILKYYFIIVNDKLIINRNNYTFKVYSYKNINVTTNNFSFSYFLQQSEPLCMLSGDQSYQEGLSLKKIVVHIGLNNKFNMIRQLYNLFGLFLENKGYNIDNITFIIKNIEKIFCTEQQNIPNINEIAQFVDVYYYSTLNSDKWNKFYETFSIMKFDVYLKNIIYEYIYDLDFTPIQNQIDSLNGGEYIKKYIKYKNIYLSLKASKR